VAAAEAMPEDRYTSAPSVGEFNGVPTFADQVKHLAANNYRVAALILVQPPTSDQDSETGPDNARSKAQIMEYLKGPFAALHRAVAQINSANATEPLAGTYNRLQLAVDSLARSYDHYGQMVEYLRMNGIVRPSSRK
jgi:DinB family protein